MSKPYVRRSKDIHMRNQSACLRLLIPLIGTFAIANVPAVFAKEDASRIYDVSESSELREATAKIANDTANGQSWFENDYRPIIIHISLDAESKKIALDMEDRLAGEAGFTEMVDLHRAIEEEIESLQTRVTGRWMFTWTYGGKSLDEIMGDDPISVVSDRARRSSVDPVDVAPVVIAAGHGHYYNYKYSDWRPHRALSNGILEDDVTPKFAEELMYYMRLNGFPSVQLRPQTGLTHKPSGLPWGRIGARYFLEQSLPDQPGIWNSLSSSALADRERREDIVSRPLYANHTSAPAIIHLHTNAAKASVSGARVYVHPGRPDSARLGKLALCSMKELIGSVERFGAFVVATDPHVASDNAENSRAKVPSIIVEAAFHTNALDAEFIKDGEFQKLAMMGVAKAYRLYKEGAECDEFSIANEEVIEVPVATQASIPVRVKGNPVYPIRIKYLPSRCYKDPCGAVSTSLSDMAQVERFRIQHFCTKEDGVKGPIEFQVTAKDFFGVATGPKVFRLTCTPRRAS